MNWCKKINVKNIGQEFIPRFNDREKRKWISFTKEFRKDVTKEIPECEGNLYYMDKEHINLRIFFNIDAIDILGYNFKDINVAQLMKIVDAKKIPKHLVKSFMLGYVRNECSELINLYRKEHVQGIKANLVSHDEFPYMDM